MSKTVPDAWDDDWVNVADVRSYALLPRSANF